MNFKVYAVVVSNLASCMDTYPHFFMLCCAILRRVQFLRWAVPRSNKYHQRLGDTLTYN
jgi:hypothetical protein